MLIAVKSLDAVRLDCAVSSSVGRLGVYFSFAERVLVR